MIQKPGILVVGARDDTGPLRSFLTAALSEFSVDSAETLSAARGILRTTQYRWLIVGQHARSGHGVELSRAAVACGVGFAQKFIAGNPDRRAVVVVDWTWEGIEVKPSRRLFYLRPCEVINVGGAFLVETIRSAEEGCCFVPPTVVTLSISRHGNAHRLRVEDIEGGPLKVYIETRLQQQPFRDRRATQVVSGFTSAARTLAAEVRKTCCTPKTLRAALVRISRRMARSLGVRRRSSPSLVELLHDAARDALSERWYSPSDPVELSGAGPYPVHLHIRGPARILSLPFDLALMSDNHGHLCVHLPVVWRWPNDRPSDPAKVNPLDLAHIRAAYSCHEQVLVSGAPGPLPGLAGVQEEVSQIATLLGLRKGQWGEVRSVESLRNAFGTDASDVRRGVHVASHGVHGACPDDSGIVVGPVSGLAPSRGVVVKAAQLRDSGAAFAYVNCCRTGQCDPAPAASYSGGFAQAAVQAGVCAEMIGNRWPVHDRWACRLAMEFYRLRPLTVHGRAVALLRARLVVLKEMTEKLHELPLDPTWLAPIHIWAEE